MASNPIKRGCVANMFQRINMKHLLQTLPVKQGEDALLLLYNSPDVAHALKY
jgi:hypothetical protein